VLFLGVGDNRSLAEDETLQPTDRSVSLKLSYAFQR
jgi:hypothetical protein